MSNQNQNSNNNNSKFKRGEITRLAIIAVTFMVISISLIVGGIITFKIAQGNVTPTNIKLKGNSGKDVKSFELDFSI